ncbi:phage portal protein [Euzebya rosea]|uniref:phage portal protein n=1 Tax=Euzebya rosea TaxID=2052804 RepID=UPI00130097D3|nr:phage portal protein [Euzebya rosea]
MDDDDLLARSPTDWIRKLEPRLRDQAEHAELHDSFYSGDRRLLLVERDFRDIFNGLLDSVRVNLSRIVVDARVERLAIDGFAVDDDDGADAVDANRVARTAAAIWRRNQLDEMAGIAHLERAIKAVSFGVVWPDDDDRATVSIEDATQMVVERRPWPPYDVVAAMKVWEDDWDGTRFCELYLPDGIHRFVGGKRLAGELWVPSSVRIASGWRPAPGTDVNGRDGRNPFGGLVPVVELTTRARLLKDPQSDLYDIAPLHDAYDVTMAQLVIAGNFSAIPIHTIAGAIIRVDKDGNPVDEDGNPTRPFDKRGDRNWVSPDKDTKFGTLQPGNLGEIIKTRAEILTGVRGLSRVPIHYFDLGGTSGVGAEMLKALEGPLVRAMAAEERALGPQWARLQQLALTIESPDLARAPLRTAWADTETRADSQDADAFSKFHTAGVPLDEAMRRAGFGERAIRHAVELNAHLLAGDDRQDGLDLPTPPRRGPTTPVPAPPPAA